MIQYRLDINKNTTYTISDMTRLENNIVTIKGILTDLGYDTSGVVGLGKVWEISDIPTLEEMERLGTDTNLLYELYLKDFYATGYYGVPSYPMVTDTYILTLEKGLYYTNGMIETLEIKKRKLNQVYSGDNLYLLGGAMYGQ